MERQIFLPANFQDFSPPTLFASEGLLFGPDVCWHQSLMGKSLSAIQRFDPIKSISQAITFPPCLSMILIR